MGRSPCLSDEVISAFLDGELTEEARRQANQHVRECAACSGELAAYRQLETVLAAPPAVDCPTALPLLSARHDRELTQAESLVAELHAATCPSCRGALVRWNTLDVAIAQLPAAMPSARVDAAVLALADRETARTHQGRRGLVRGLALRGAVALTVVGAILLATLQQQTGPEPEQQAAAPGPIVAYVAAVQQMLLNPKTNTLYVAHPDAGIVAAFNATTQADIAMIVVGGRPTALALNETANTILVLDSSQSTLIEIDGATNRVLGTTALGITGTVTALQVDPANGKIFTAIAPAQPQASPSIAVFDGTSKKLESTRSVPVAVRQVMLDPLGQRALLVSADVTTIVDATTYKQLNQLPGGVAATFSTKGNTAAVLGAVAGGSRVTIVGEQNATVNLDGAPLALLPLPQGGFAVLLDDGSTGRIVEISANGAAGPATRVPLVGREITYNSASKTYAVAGDRGVAFVSMGVGTVATVPNEAPVAAITPPGASAPPAAVTPSGPPAVAARPGPAIEKRTIVPEGATLAWPDMYRYELSSQAAPVVVGRGRAGQLWFVDAQNKLMTLDASTGQAFPIAELPKDVHVRSIEVGRSYVYVIDVAASRVYVVSIASERLLNEVRLPFVKSSSAVTVTPDDTLWFAVADQILRFDPITSKVEAAPVGFYSVGAMAADSAGRVWFTDEVNAKLGIYDRRDHAVSTFNLPRKGAVTTMVVDATGTLWAGTDAGELFAVRGSELVGSGQLARPVRQLTLDAIGTAWFWVGDTLSGQLGRVQAPASAQTIPASVSGLWFDAESHAWLADRTSSGFFIAVPGAR